MRAQVEPKFTPELLLQIEKGESYEAMKASSGWAHFVEALDLMPNSWLEKMRRNVSNDPGVALHMLRYWQVALELRGEILDEVDGFIDAKNQILKDHGLEPEGDE